MSPFALEEGEARSLFAEDYKLAAIGARVVTKVSLPRQTKLARFVAIRFKKKKVAKEIQQGSEFINKLLKLATIQCQACCFFYTIGPAGGRPMLKEASWRHEVAILDTPKKFCNSRIMKLNLNFSATLT